MEHLVVEGMQSEFYKSWILGGIYWLLIKIRTL